MRTALAGARGGSWFSLRWPPSSLAVPAVRVLQSIQDDT